MNRIDKLLLSELRLLKSKEATKATQGNLEMAILDNENLRALGYELDYNSLIQLAKDYKSNPEMTPLHKRVQELEPGIEVSPMYPGFPMQVLEMSELEYRTNQLIHYLTTYGIETMFDVEVKEGWLPYNKDTFVERKTDNQVVPLKTLNYLTETEIEQIVIDKLIGRKERLQPKELEIAQFVMLATNLPITEIPFKENIGAIYGDVLLTGKPEETSKVFKSLENIVKHPGDVLDLVEYMVVKNKYKHFKTSVKRGLVNLIEKFPADAIEENLASNRWSNTFLGKKGKRRAVNRNIALIDYLSFTRFSKSDDSMKIVNELKDGKLISWNQNLELAYSNGNLDEALRLLNQRPGMLFRQVNRLVTLGVEPNKIAKLLKANAGQLKTQSIISALNNYDGLVEVDKVFVSTLVSNLLTKDIEVLQGKNIFIDEKDVIFGKSRLEITDKFEGYITNGLAIKIPEEVGVVRFFTYWNDKERIDIDLHGVAIDSEENKTHIGWSGGFRGASMVHSGDITHSNAVEYIDMDFDRAMEEGIEFIQFNINSYTGEPFKDIETVFTGLMGVSHLKEMKEKASLFDAKNVFFRHDLEYNADSVNYAIIDIKNRLLYIEGSRLAGRNDTEFNGIPKIKLDIMSYLQMLILTQGGKIVENKEDADLTLGLAKADEENYISLVDNNFFMD